MQQAKAKRRAAARVARTRKQTPAEQRERELAEWRELWAWAFETRDNMQKHIAHVEIVLREGTSLMPVAEVRARADEIRAQLAWLSERMHKYTDRSDNALASLRDLKAAHAERDMGRQSIAEAVEAVRLYFETRPQSRLRARAWSKVRARLRGSWSDEKIETLPLEWAVDGVINSMLVRGLVLHTDAAKDPSASELHRRIGVAIAQLADARGIAGAAYVGRSPLYKALAVVARFGGFGDRGGEQVRRIHEAFAEGPLGSWILRVVRQPPRRRKLSGN